MRGIIESQNLYYKTIFESATSGQYPLELLKESYIIEMYGAGGGWANSKWSTDTWYHNTVGGGSGAGFKGFITLEPGTYVVNIGGGGGNADGAWNSSATGGRGGNSSFGDLITAGGGTGGYGYMGNATAGVGGALTINASAAVVSYTLSSKGKNGGIVGGAYSYGPQAVAGGASLYDGTRTGYGAGGGYPYSAISGYCRIWELSDEDNYDFVIKDTTALLPYNKVNKKYYSIGENYGN